MKIKENSMITTIKGQVITKALFEILDSSKKRTKEFDLTTNNYDTSGFSQTLELCRKSE